MKSTKFKCIVKDIDESVVEKGEKSFRKAVLKLETEDSQVIFAELKNKDINKLDRQKIIVDSIVEVEVLFIGSEKNGKKYNNICIKNITRING